MKIVRGHRQQGRVPLIGCGRILLTQKRKEIDCISGEVAEHRIRELKSPRNICLEQLPREIQSLPRGLGSVERIGRRFISGVRCFLLLFNLELAEKLFAERAIVTSRESQHFTANIPWSRDGHVPTVLRLLLRDLFLKFSLRFLIDDLCGLPSLAKHRPCSIRISRPEHVRNPSLRASTQCLIGEAAGIGSETNQKRLGIVASFFSDALGFRIFR